MQDPNTGRHATIPTMPRTHKTQMCIHPCHEEHSRLSYIWQGFLRQEAWRQKKMHMLPILSQLHLFSTYESACNMALDHPLPLPIVVPQFIPLTLTETDLSPMPTFISAKKKYKPVLEDLPAKFHII